MASSGYITWAVTAGEQPTTAYWNILGSNDASFNSGSGFNDGIILTRHLAAGSVNTTAMRPNYLVSTGNNNGTGSRQTSSTSFTVTGTSLSYTTGTTNELLDIRGYGLVQGASAGSGLVIQVNGTTVGVRGYSDTTTYVTHYPYAMYAATANSSYTITLLCIASGSTNICNSTGDNGNFFSPLLEMIAWSKT